MRYFTIALLALSSFHCRAASAATAPAQYAGWPQSGSTTPEAADIEAGVVVKDFPVLVRLSSASFDFTKAQVHGRSPGRSCKRAMRSPFRNRRSRSRRAGAWRAWSQDKLIRGTNGIAALTFCDVVFH